MQPPCLYSRSCDEVDDLKQSQFDLKPAESTKYKNPAQSNSTTPKGRTKLFKAFYLFSSPIHPHKACFIRVYLKIYFSMLKSPILWSFSNVCIF